MVDDQDSGVDHNPSPRTFDGVVLTGGKSRRMGSDKAQLEIDGTALAARTATELRSAGADKVLCVGGATSVLRSLGLVAIEDHEPDQGPLGGMLTGFGATSAEVVVILACDMPLIGAKEIGHIVDTLLARPGAVVAAPRLSNRWQFLTAAWRRKEAARVLRHAYDDGERSVRRAVDASLEIAEVALERPGRVEDADTPADLERLLERSD